MPNNFNTAAIKTFLARISAPRNIFLGSLSAIVLVLMYRSLNNENGVMADEANQKEKYKKELNDARDSLKLEQNNLKRCETRNAEIKVWQDSVDVLNQKLDECRGKKKAVANRTSVKRTTASSSLKSSSVVSASSKQSASRGEGLINFYDSSTNQAGGIIINVYDCNGKLKAQVVPGTKQDASVRGVTNVVSSQTLDTSTTVTDGVKKAVQGRKVLLTEIVTTEETRQR